ncbi:MAG: hypothetical protein H0X13_01170 [Ramlibacter sp.]|nr:hypothetical protein [Ramlibacter sp.]
MHFPCLSTTTASRVARIIGLLALTAVLAACNAIKLGYNNLDEVAYWWLDGYVDFTDEQATLVRQDIARIHLWHRTHELPRVGALLRELEELAPNDISTPRACAFVPALRERLQAVADQAEPAVVTLAMGLGPQLQHLERKYEKNNADYRKEWVKLSPAEQADKRVRKFLERGEMIYGALDEPQRIALRRQVEQSVFDPRRILAERQRRQQDALQTLRKLTGQPVPFSEARRLLRDYLARAQESPDAAYRGYQEKLVEESCRSFAALHNSTTASQRAAAVRQLRAYQRDFAELAARR